MVGITNSSAFSDGVLSCRDMHLRFLFSVVHDFKAHLFLLLNNSPFSGDTAADLFVHLTMIILVDSKFRHISIKQPYTFF
jgi:hypothetical protein